MPAVSIVDDWRGGKIMKCIYESKKNIVLATKILLKATVKILCVNILYKFN